MKKMLSLSLLLIILVCPALANAATLTSVDISQTVQTEDALFIFFDVADETGEPLSGISSEDVIISIGRKDYVPSVQTMAKSELGIGYVFAVDISKSLSEEQFEGVREAIVSWIDGMGEMDQAAILTFGDEITLLSDFTADTAALQSIAEGIAPTDSNTQLYNGILRGLDVAKRQSTELPIRRVLVILSDGMDDFPSGATMAEVTEKADDAGVPIYAVGVEDRDNHAELNELGSIARLSGGELYLTEQDALLRGYETIYQRIQSGYVAQIVLDHTVADGSEKGLILSVKQGSVFVEDSLDVRLRAVASPAPAPTLASTPAPTPTAMLVSVQEPEKEMNAPLLIIAGSIVVLTAIVIVILAVRKRKAAKAENEKIEEIKRRQKLDELIDVKVGKAGGDKTRALGNESAELSEDKTVPLGGSQQRLMLSLGDIKSGGERRYTAPMRDKLTVGRKPGEVDIVIQDRSISGRHCQFDLRNERLYLKDLNSTNGTYLIIKKEKQRVVGDSTVVRNGDVILLGETELSITIYED